MQSRFLVQAMGVVIAMFLLSSQSFAQTDEHPIEVGGLVTAIDLRDTIGEKPLGVGGRFTYNFTKNIAVDSEVSYFPENGSGDFGETIALVGVKAGARSEKFGAFAKIRPGIVHFGGNAFQSFNNSQSKFALDVGGVIEFYPTSRAIIRVDVGDTIIAFGDEAINRPVPPFVIRPGTTHNLQTSFGIGYRF